MSKDLMMDQYLSSDEFMQSPSSHNSPTTSDNNNDVSLLVSPRNDIEHDLNGLSGDKLSTPQDANEVKIEKGERKDELLALDTSFCPSLGLGSVGDDDDDDDNDERESDASESSYVFTAGLYKKNRLSDTWERKSIDGNLTLKSTTSPAKHDTITEDMSHGENDISTHECESENVSRNDMEEAKIDDEVSHEKKNSWKSHIEQQLEGLESMMTHIKDAPNSNIIHNRKTTCESEDTVMNVNDFDEEKSDVSLTNGDNQLASDSFLQDSNKEHATLVTTTDTLEQDQSDNREVNIPNDVSEADDFSSKSQNDILEESNISKSPTSAKKFFMNFVRQGRKSILNSEMEEPQMTPYDGESSSKDGLFAVNQGSMEECKNGGIETDNFDLSLVETQPNNDEINNISPISLASSKIHNENANEEARTPSRKLSNPERNRAEKYISPVASCSLEYSPYSYQTEDFLPNRRSHLSERSRKSVKTSKATDQRSVERDSMDLSSAKKKLGATSTALMEKLRGASQRRKLLVSRSSDSFAAKERQQVRTVAKLETRESSSICANKKTNKNKLNSAPLEKAHDISKQFKARALSTTTILSHGGQIGVPKIDKKPLTRPCSPDLGPKRRSSEKDQISASLRKVRAEALAREKLIKSVSAVKRPPKTSSLAKKKLPPKDDPYIPFKARPIQSSPIPLRPAHLLAIKEIKKKPSCNFSLNLAPEENPVIPFKARPLPATTKDFGSSNTQKARKPPHKELSIETNPKEMVENQTGHSSLHLQVSKMGFSGQAHIDRNERQKKKRNDIKVFDERKHDETCVMPDSSKKRNSLLGIEFLEDTPIKHEKRAELFDTENIVPNIRYDGDSSDCGLESPAKRRRCSSSSVSQLSTSAHAKERKNPESQRVLRGKTALKENAEIRQSIISRNLENLERLRNELR